MKRGTKSTCQNGHFGMTSLFWRPPSDSVVERLQRRLSTSRVGIQKQSASRSTLNEDIKSMWSERDRKDWEVWATEETGIGVEEDVDILKANSSMLSAWESCESNDDTGMTDIAVAYHKLQLDSDAATAETIIHLLKVS